MPLSHFVVGRILLKEHLGSMTYLMVYRRAGDAGDRKTGVLGVAIFVGDLLQGQKEDSQGHISGNMI